MLEVSVEGKDGGERLLSSLRPFVVFFFGCCSDNGDDGDDDDDGADGEVVALKTIMGKVYK